MKGFGSLRKRCLVAASVALVALATPVPASAEGQTVSSTDSAKTPHCLLQVTGKKDVGLKYPMFETAPLQCFATYAEVLRASGPVVVPDNISSDKASIALRPDVIQADGIIGIHYEYANGTGATLTVSGSNCTGGGLNVPIAWNDRISSTYNGCPTILHYETTNYAGGSFSTYTSGYLSNITGYYDNKTSSILYY